MTTTDATILILQRIQDTLAGHDARFDAIDARFDAIDARFDTVDERLFNVESHVVAHSEILGIMNERLGFFERAATVANEGRARLETRVDQVQARVYAVEDRVGELEAKEPGARAGADDPDD